MAWDFRNVVVVKGEGPYIGYFITEGMARYPGSTWHDQTRRTKAAIELEQKLQRTGHARKRPSYRCRCADHRGAEIDPDVTVTFTREGIKLKQRLKARHVRLDGITTMGKLEQAFTRVFQAMDTMLD
ncbi:MAG: hypothetical protein KDE55_18880 [Novosphingobium sp.]|nr:hypothetical protein [Novosphingobium sp.]